MFPRYKFSDTEPTLVTEIPVGVVSPITGFIFDRPFILPSKGVLKLKNGEWFVVRIINGKEDAALQSGMWKVWR